MITRLNHPTTAPQSMNFCPYDWMELIRSFDLRQDPLITCGVCGLLSGVQFKENLLMTALRAKQLEMAEFLLDNGVDHNFTTTLLVSPLSLSSASIGVV